MPTDAGTGAHVRLRPAGPPDLSALADLHLRTRLAAVPEMPPPAHPADDVRAWVRGWDLAHQDVWLAEDADGGVLGYARATRTWLEDLYVDPDAQGGGIGSMLLELVKSHRPLGLGLWVFESNTRAQAFYARHGFGVVRRTDGSDNEERAPDLEMSWFGPDPVAGLRRRIDDVDDRLAGLLAERAALTAAVQRLKDVPGHAGRDPDREAAIVARMASRGPAVGDRLGAERLARIMHVVISESLDAAE